MTARPGGSRRSGGAAGKSPASARRNPQQSKRTRAPLPSRVEAAPAKVTRARRAQLTARAIVLAVAVISVALTLAIPFKTWLSQRAQIKQAQLQNVQAEARIVQLQHDEKQWQNPTYIEHQATRRLHMVSPGQKSYIVTDKVQHKSHHSKSTMTSTDQPWYAQLWSPTGN